MSKLGTHTGTQPTGLGDFLSQTYAVGSVVPLLFGLDLNLAATIAQYSPPTKWIFRTQKFGADTGEMYQGDALTAGRAWVDVCYPEWQLNHANWYAPINEPGRSDAVGLTWLCNFYLGCMQRADELGVKLCVGEWSTGQPPLDQVALYVPMLRYAMAHGHILGLHEYSLSGPMQGSPLCLRYRQLYSALPADARPLLAITECGSGAGYGTALFGQPYIEDAGWYDTELMQNKWVIGAALFRLGKGESNMAEVMPQLTQWIIDHPTPEVEPVAIIPLCGLHSPASAGDISAVELSAIDRAARFASYKFQTGDTPAHYAAIAAHGIPLASCFTRLSMDMRNRPKPTPQEFVNDMFTAITEARNVGIRFFEIHNEPNIQAVEWPWSSDPHDFITWLLQVIPLLRATFPGIGLISPGMAPAANTDLWWQEFAEHGVFNNVEGIGAHVYWPDRATMLTQAQGLHFIPLVQYSSATKSIIITELSNNINGDTDYDKGLQYIDWCSYVAAHYPTVTRSYWYALSSTTQSDNDSRQTLVRNGAITPIADGIRDGVFNPVPAPQYVYQHSHLDGGLANTSKMITITMNQAHNLVGDYAEVAPVVKQFPLTITTTPAGAGSFTVTPPLPANGLYNEGTIVTVVFA